MCQALGTCNEQELIANGEIGNEQGIKQIIKNHERNKIEDRRLEQSHLDRVIRDFIEKRRFWM